MEGRHRERTRTTLQTNRQQARLEIHILIPRHGKGWRERMRSSMYLVSVLTFDQVPGP